MSTMSTIDYDYFASIDTPEKAYIFGLVLFNIEREKVNINEPSLIDPSSQPKRDAFARDIEVSFSSQNVNNIYDKIVSYNDYKKTDNERNPYKIPYYSNLDVVISHLKKLGEVAWEVDKNNANNNTVWLTISSRQIIQDLFKRVKNPILIIDDLMYIIDSLHSEASAATAATDGDELVKHFMRAYIEKHGTIVGNYLHLTLCNTEEDNVGKIRNLYKIPCTLTNFNSASSVNYSRLIYCDANMIDFLGIFYSDPDILYVSKKMYDFTDGGCGGCGSDGDLEKYCSYSEATTPTIKVLKDDESAVMPSKASYSDAGYDLTIIKEHKVLNSDTKLYDTGIKLDIPNGYYVEIVPRSSISRSGYMLANNVGIIDQGYRGNLYIALRKVNKDCEDLVLPWKCCQFIVKKQIFSRLKLSTEDLTKTRRDCGGFGSSDLVPLNIQKVLLYNNA